MTNNQIADVLEQIADLLEFQAANAFRIRAYRNAGRVIRNLPEALSTMIDEDRDLTEIDGIGKDMAAKCTLLVQTGSLPMLDELRSQIPTSTLKLLRIPGLGPKRAAIIHQELGVSSLEELKVACEAERVRALKGFGPKTEQTILAGMKIAAAADERIYWSKADEIVQDLKRHMAACQAVDQLEMAGSYRRGKETVGDLDMLVVASDGEAVMDHFGAFPAFIDTIVRGSTKMSVRTDQGLQVDLRVVPERSFGAALQYFTGSKEHNVEIRGRAKKMGLKVNEWGVFRVSEDAEEDATADAGEYVAGVGEEEVYAALGWPLFPPELREARQEFEWAERGEVPDLVTLHDIQGDLHMHTTETDGKASLEEMVAAAKSLGLSYIAITDHSQRVSMANGLDPDRLRAQWAKVDLANAAEGDEFMILKGIECDILEQGGMDLPSDVLAAADWVLASVHYGQKQSKQQITERVLEAIEHPHVSAIAHPTGRLINRREPYEIDMDQVMAAAKRSGKLLELNANPARLDLNDYYCAAAQRLGIPIVISTDAHSVKELSVMRYGVLQARRGGLTKSDVANTRTWKDLQQLIGRSPTTVH